MSEPVTIYIRHLRAEGICASGGRQWFARHDLSWSDFLDNGVSSEVLEATGDTFVNRVIDRARAEAQEIAR